MKCIIRKNGIKFIPESNLDNDLLHSWDHTTVTFSETHCVSDGGEYGFRLSGRSYIIETFIGFKDKKE